jgi:hypothetical protein
MTGRPSEHGRRDVDAPDLLEARRECLGEAAEAAAEVECGARGQYGADAFQKPEDAGDLLFPRPEEMRRLPAAALEPGIGQNGPHGILPAEQVPVSLQLADIHPDPLHGRCHESPMMRSAGS